MSTASAETNVKDGVVDNAGWIDAWASGRTDFHQSTHDRFLDLKEAEVFEGKTKSVFMPLCGKSLDILWMYNHGHTVCGVEIAELAIQQFFEEHGIEFEVKTLENIGKLYKSKDDRLQLYVADLFEMTPELCGQFDIIFDSKSFVAINKSDRQKYVNVLLSLMKTDGKYYLSAFDYDQSVWPGPPHSTPGEVVNSCYSDRCNIELLEDADQVMKEKQASSVEPPVPQQDYEDFPSAIRAATYAMFRWYKLTMKQS
ncbi:probable thiopurine S-methyltransferase isoform X2 [Mercenaria mercenaria]|nr:probable thiopurine S-methyltransferase isoform X2 [Mercenaria mercenaria]